MKPGISIYSFIFGPRYTLATQEQFKSNLRLTTKQLRNIEAQRNSRNPYKEEYATKKLKILK